MAEEKKSIEISYKANLKDLVSKLKTLPSVTGAEAKKMVAELDRQLKQAERAAKKSADAQKKAAAAARKAFQQNRSAISGVNDAAKQTEEKLEGVADSAGEVDRGFASIGLALSAVNPQLGEAAMLGADVAAVSEGLLLTFKNLNPIVLGLGTALAALTLGYAAYSQEMEKARQKTIAIRIAEEEHAKALEESREVVRDAEKSFRDINEELLVLQGRLSESTFEMRQLTRATRAQFSTQEIDQRIEALKEDSKLIQRAGQDMKSLSDSEKERLNAILESTAGLEKQDKFFESGTIRTNNLKKALEGVNGQIADQMQIRNDVLDKERKAVAAAVELKEIKDKQAEDERKEDERKEAAAKAEEKRQKEEQERFNKLLEDRKSELEVQKIINSTTDAEKTFQAKQELELSLVKLRETEHEKAIREIEERFKADEQRLKKLALISGEEFTHQITIAELRLRKEQEIHELSLKNREQLKELDEEIIKDLIGDLGTIASDLEMIYSNLFINQKNVVAERQKEREEFDKLSQMEQDRITRQKKIMTAFFRAEQALSIADIGMSTAEAVMKAQAVYGPGTPQAIAASILAVATGATQSAVVASKQPPSFHMGGVAPDEMGARVLRGEAILDRATVRRIGGEQGVKQLQQQGSDRDQVVIIQPFRHFGRFAREIGFTSPKNTGIKAY